MEKEHDNQYNSKQEISTKLDQLITKLDQLVSATLNNKLAPKVGFDKVLWDTSQIAEYISVSYKYASEYVVTHHTFPLAIRIHNKSGKSGHPRWYAKEVIDWVAKWRE